MQQLLLLLIPLESLQQQPLPQLPQPRSRVRLPPPLLEGRLEAPKILLPPLPLGQVRMSPLMVVLVRITFRSGASRG